MSNIWSLALGAVLALGSSMALGAVEKDFGALDQDQDGVISKQETEADLAVARSWYLYDENDDGKLSQSEFSALTEQEESTMLPFDTFTEISLNDAFYM